MSFVPASTDGMKRELENAELNLNHHLEERKHHDDEVMRWQMVVDQLKETIAVLESPATKVRKIPSDSAPKTRIRWKKEWPTVLGELAAKNVHPTKRALMSELRARYQVSETNASQAVYNGISAGYIVVKMDLCYLAGAEPRLPQVVSA